eukprot:jgi/Mesvir1/8148/Mv12461-RA.1
MNHYHRNPQIRNPKLDPDSTVGELKRKICECTNVLPKRQKLLNLKVKGKLAEDDVPIKDVALKPGTKISVMGTPEDQIPVEPDLSELPEIKDDFEEDVREEVAVPHREENLAKLKRRAQSFKWSRILSEPRPGKKLLVLDIDYTLFDHRSPAERPVELMRPYLHEFLTAAYAHYDIVIWSATSMKWIEVKMSELGVSSHPDYKLLALVDHTAMITVTAGSYGVFDCKPLAVIWARFPTAYGPHNTIMFDDLRRNFIMNPQNGLKIRPFRDAHQTRGSDIELLRLTEYLQLIATLDTLEALNHRHWEDYVQRNGGM